MEDEDELAELRAQRAARTGQGASLVCSRHSRAFRRVRSLIELDALLQAQLRELQRQSEAGNQDLHYYDRCTCSACCHTSVSLIA